VFLDGDYSDYPDELTQLIVHIRKQYWFCCWLQSGSIKRKKLDDATANFWELASNNFNENL
jgi:hypothetical protein